MVLKFLHSSVASACHGVPQFFAATSAIKPAQMPDELRVAQDRSVFQLASFLKTFRGAKASFADSPVKGMFSALDHGPA